MNILHEADRLTSGDRKQSYGHALDDYTRTAAMVSAMLAHKLTEPLTAEDMELVMVQVKISRQMHKPGIDNLVDAAGYLRLVQVTEDERVIRSRKGRKK